MVFFQALDSLTCMLHLWRVALDVKSKTLDKWEDLCTKCFFAQWWRRQLHIIKRTCKKYRDVSTLASRSLTQVQLCHTVPFQVWKTLVKHASAHRRLASRGIQSTGEEACSLRDSLFLVWARSSAARSSERRTVMLQHESILWLIHREDGVKQQLNTLILFHAWRRCLDLVHNYISTWESFSVLKLRVAQSDVQTKELKRQAERCFSYRCSLQRVCEQKTNASTLAVAH